MTPAQVAALAAALPCYDTLATGLIVAQWLFLARAPHCRDVAAAGGAGARRHDPRPCR
ncbi:MULTISPECIES: hypothetical protein [unclassified Nonomuraea]|uniref:hypothetical protein n=1 Tax=unclassified Nonomuraea TaxID=2593643 RepID=UPI0033C75B80